jgi:hypothetical protein
MQKKGHVNYIFYYTKCAFFPYDLFFYQLGTFYIFVLQHFHLCRLSLCLFLYTVAFKLDTGKSTMKKIQCVYSWIHVKTCSLSLSLANISQVLSHINRHSYSARSSTRFSKNHHNRKEQIEVKIIFNIHREKPGKKEKEKEEAEYEVYSVTRKRNKRNHGKKDNSPKREQSFCEMQTSIDKEIRQEKKKTCVGSVVRDGQMREMRCWIQKSRG